MFRCATALVCLAATSLLFSPRPAGAQYFGRNKVQNARLEFRTLQTEHFDIYYYPEEEQATRQAARMAERWYARYSQLLDDTFSHRQAIVLYASHPDFTQTNVSSATVDEGTGGFTERIKSRIVMPFAPGLGETDHVLGHELAHAFQLDIAKREHQNAFDLPGWFIEGMAEYLSIGPANAFTNMWLRDAKLHHRLPTIEQLENPRYFPYRYGHAFWSYLGARFGDEIVGKLLRSKARGVVARLEDVTGKTRDELTRDWHESVPTEDDGPDLAVTPRAIVTSADGGRVHVAPAISPDGRRIMFVSERDRLSLDLFMADAGSGAVVKKVISTAADPHFDSLQYIHSAGAWDATGRRFVLAALIDSTPALSIVDTNGASPRRDIRLRGFGEIYNPSWSPDGKQIVFSAMKGGVSDLFVYSLADGTLAQLTDDAFADLHPSWSPDGKTIAFASDRFTTSLDELRFGAVRVALLDVATKIVRPLTASADGGKQISPQWSPDGEAIYYVADPDSVSNVYRVELASGDIRRVTSERGGVSGITATSPALAVASSSGRLAFNAYRDGRYEIQTLEQTSAQSAPIVTAGVATKTATPGPLGKLAQLLSNTHVGLPANGEFLTSKYDDRLRIETIAEPYIGAAVGGGGMVGGVLRANFGVTFGDMLRDRQLQLMVRVGTNKDDYAAQVAYVNRKGRLNWGFIGGFIPARFIGAKRSIIRSPTLVTQEYANLRYTHEFASMTARYNVSRATRFEFRGGARRTGYGWQTLTRAIDATSRKLVTHMVQELPGAPAVYLAEMQAAYVRDTAVLGPTSPVLGQRLRLDVEPAVGGLMFADVRLDARRYFMPLRPATLAFRIQHTGRYGRDAGDPRLTPLLLGLQTLVRGYDLSTFGAERCGRYATSCSMVDQLSGNRFAVMNVELRAPMLGLLTGNLDYGRTPIEALIFADGAMLWTPHPNGPLERDRFSSVGAGVRANLGGFVLETTGVRPFDKPQKGWTVSFLIRPGF
ncbi:MAG TPA: BamA/TamA family outer membrane protein [Vicinamibacterales bacterium]